MKVTVVIIEIDFCSAVRRKRDIDEYYIIWLYIGSFTRLAVGLRLTVGLHTFLAEFGIRAWFRPMFLTD
jgi:hypothetical protein